MKNFADNPHWDKIHDEHESWRTKLIGELAYTYALPRSLELFEKHFSGGGPSTFLELGAGNGELSQRIVKIKFPFVKHYLATEQFPEGVEWLRRKGLEASLVDAQNIPFPDESFDVVLSLDALHHVSDPKRMAYEMLRTARGRLYLTESNGLSIGRKLMELTPGHRRAGERSYSPWKYRSFFEHPGFKITSFQIHPYLFPIRVPHPFIQYVVSFNRWIENTPFLNWQCSSVYIYIEYERTQGCSLD